MLEPITVLIVESLPLIRRGLVAALGEDPEIDVVGVVDDGLAAVEAAKRLNPRVVVMGSQLQHVDGIHGTHQIRADLPGTQVLILGTSEDDAMIFSAIEAGAIGYVLHDITPEDLREAIHNVCNGMTMVHPRVMRKMVHRLTLLSQRGGSGQPGGLTARELEVLRSMAAGKSDKEIGQHLSVTEATVKSHIRTVFNKMGTTNRCQAVAMAMRIGLIR